MFESQGMTDILQIRDAQISAVISYSVRNWKGRSFIEMKYIWQVMWLSGNSWKILQYYYK